ncbi:hypothetical protein HSEST_1903 [Halapricum desulfuricans]|uniref:Uncharacterized protein n=1 Tax=Halapricum desulfuricans TaxID=2841257 RepID=A0A897NRI3_9EURY|nr:hypothetical protein HSEST_1903 [Halapricum desulfuricans]
MTSWALERNNSSPASFTYQSLAAFTYRVESRFFFECIRSDGVVSVLKCQIKITHRRE